MYVAMAMGVGLERDASASVEVDRYPLKKN
jgi:hypothetical protein